MQFMETLQSIPNPDFRYCHPEFIPKYLSWNRNVKQIRLGGGCSSSKWIKIIDAVEKTNTRYTTITVVYNPDIPHERIMKYLNSDLASDLSRISILNAYDGMTNIPQEHKIFNGFHNHVNLTRLELRYHCMDRNTSLSLARLLEATTSIKTLILEDLFTSHFEAIFKAVSESNTLTHFHLESIQLTRSEIITMKRALLKNSNIVVFRYIHAIITNNIMGFAHEGLPPGCPTRWLYTLISDNTAIKTLDLSSCHLTDDVLINISRGLTRNKTLENLVLSDEKFGAIGLDYLCATLSDHNTTLKSLDLSYNQLTRDLKTMIPLMKYLEKNGPLKSLNLSGNGFNGSDLIHLLLYLGSNTNLVTLHLRASCTTSADLYSVERAVVYLNITHINLECELTDRVNMINLRLSRNGKQVNKYDYLSTEYFDMSDIAKY